MTTTQEKPAGAVDGKFFCQNCNSNKPIQGACRTPTANGRMRWTCASCVAKKAAKGKR